MHSAKKLKADTPKAKTTQKSKRIKIQKAAQNPKVGEKFVPPVAPKKVSTAKNVKANGNGKSNGKIKTTAMKKPTAKSKKAAAKNGKIASSRKQLAF